MNDDLESKKVRMKGEVPDTDAHNNADVAETPGSSKQSSFDHKGENEKNAEKNSSENGKIQCLYLEFQINAEVGICSKFSGVFEPRCSFKLFRIKIVYFSFLD